LWERKTGTFGSNSRVRKIRATNGSMDIKRVPGERTLMGEITCVSPSSTNNGAHVILEQTQYPKFLTRAHHELKNLVSYKCIPDTVLDRARNEHIEVGPFGEFLLVPANKGIQFIESQGLLEVVSGDAMELAGDIRDFTGDDNMMVMVKVPETAGPSQRSVLLLERVSKFLDRLVNEDFDVATVINSIMRDGRAFTKTVEHFSVQIWIIDNRYKLFITERVEASVAKIFDNDVCPICLEEAQCERAIEFVESRLQKTCDSEDPRCVEQEEDLVPLTCGHCYHEDCISQWAQVSNKCPLCKTAII